MPTLTQETSSPHPPTTGVMSLREYWLLLNSYDWDSVQLALDGEDPLSERWLEKYVPIYDRILDIAEASEVHQDLADDFMSYGLRLNAKPPLPLC